MPSICNDLTESHNVEFGGFHSEFMQLPIPNVLVIDVEDHSSHPRSPEKNISPPGGLTTAAAGMRTKE